MKVLIHAANDRGIAITNKAVADRFVNDPGYFAGVVTTAIAADVKVLWADAGIQNAYKRQAEFNSMILLNTILRLSIDWQPQSIFQQNKMFLDQELKQLELLRQNSLLKELTSKWSM